MGYIPTDTYLKYFNTKKKNIGTCKEIILNILFETSNSLRVL